jgi:hypothetical protein
LGDVVSAKVSSRGDEQDAGRRGALYGRLQGVASTASTPGVVANCHRVASVTQGDPVINRAYGVGGAACSISREKLSADDLSAPRNAGKTRSIVTPGGDDTGAVRAVTVIIEGISAACDGVDAVNIIDISVTIVIDPVTRDLSGINPDISGQIRMGILNTAIDDKHQ